MDFFRQWRRRCRIIEDESLLIATLKKLKDELENRKRIFAAEECANIHEYVLVFYSGFQTVSISERKRSSLGVMTFCVKWYLPNKRQIRTHPRLGTSSDFVVLAETAGLESGTAFYHGKKVIG